MWVAAGAGLAAFGISSSLRKLLGEDGQISEPSIKVARTPVLFEPVKIATESKHDETPFEMVFGGLAEDQKREAAEIVRNAKVWIHNNTSYRQMLSVTRQYEEEIRQMAQGAGIPEQLVLGMILIENGGGEDKISGQDARGIAQLVPETAREYELKVEENWREGGIDERADPIKSIGAMGRFLKDHLGKFHGNLGLTLWSYHGGIGNVYRALAIYVQKSEGVEFGDLRDEKDRLGKYNIHQVVSEPVVQEKLIAKLKDESDLYPYKVVAAAELFREEV